MYLCAHSDINISKILQEVWNSYLLVSGCLKKCNAQGIFTGWAVYAALRNAQLITPRMGKIPSKFNVDFFRKMTGEACG